MRADAPVAGPLATISYPQLCANGAQCGYYESTPYHAAFGLSASIPLARRLSLHFEPAYQRIGITATTYAFEYQTTVDSPLGEVVGQISSTANRWLFPVILEARILPHLQVGVGAAVSVLTSDQTTGKVVDPFYGTRFYDANYFRPVTRQVIVGIPAVLEFPFRVGRVTLAPDLRYIRWFARHYGGSWAMDEFSAGLAVRFSP